MALSSRVFRVFISSTFSDLITERNALQERVFPRLRELANSQDYRFQAIDLRWGVSEEASLDQQAMNICLGEIARCRKTSPRPNFIVLLGDRYGWCPPPSQIPDDEFAQIQETIMSEADRAFLTDWYFLDRNAVPPVWCLKPRLKGGEFGNYDNWQPVEEHLHTILSEAASKLSFTTQQRLPYTASATEQEINAGAMSVKDAPEHVFCFFRNVDNFTEHVNLLNQPQLKNFLNVNEKAGGVDKSAYKKQCDLKQQLIDKFGDHVYQYQAHWKGEGVSINHIDRLCKDVYSSLAHIIQEEMEHPHPTYPVEEAVIRIHPDASLDAEGLAHYQFAEERLRFFVGRTETLANIGLYLQDNQHRSLVITGSGGTGKSALMAKAIQQSQEKLPTAEIVYRFIGVTPGSSDGRSLLEGLCHELSRRYGATEVDIPTGYRELALELRKRLRLTNADRPLILFLDSLDQLSANQNARSLIWLPDELPEHVSVITSTREEDTYKVMQTKQARVVKLGGLSRKEGEDLLSQWLASARRTLQENQSKEVLEKFYQSGANPLYLKLAFEEARLWKSEPDQQPEQLEAGVIGIIQKNMIDRLMAEVSHGEVLVSHALGYLAASRYGLAEDELLDLLSRDRQVYAWFFKQSYHIPADMLRWAIQYRRTHLAQKTNANAGSYDNDENDASAWLREIRDRPEQISEFLKEVLAEVDGPRLPVVLWSRLFFDLAPYLSERLLDGSLLLTFYHRELGDVSSSTFLAEARDKTYHTGLAEYFRFKADPGGEGLWTGGSRRGLSELPFHLTQAAIWGELHAILTNFEFLQSKITACGPESLIDDYNLALVEGGEKRDLSLLRDAIRMSAHVFKQDASQLAGHLIARLLNVKDEPAIQNLLTNARPRTEGVWLRPLTFSLAAPGGMLERMLTGCEKGITALAISRDRIISAHQDQTIRLWDRVSGQEVAVLDNSSVSIPILAGNYDPILAVASEADLLLSGSSGKIRCWRLYDGSETGSILMADPANRLISLAVMSDGLRAVSFHVNLIRVWDLQNRMMVAEIPNKLMQTLSDDLTRVVVLDEKQTLVVYDLQSGQIERRLSESKGFVPPGSPICLKLTKDGTVIVGYRSDKGDTLICRDLKTGKQGPIHRHKGWIQSICSTPDGRRVFFTDDRWIWRWDTGKFLSRPVQVNPAKDSPPPLESLIAHPIKPWVVTYGQDITVWDHSQREFVFTISSPANNFAIAPDGLQAVSGKEEGVIHVWRLDQEAAKTKERLHMGEVNTAVFQRDSSQAFTVSDDGILGTWSPKGDSSFQRISDQRSRQDLEVCRQGNRIVCRSNFTNSNKHSILWWDLPLGSWIPKRFDTLYDLNYLVVTPDGHWVVSGSGRTAFVYDLNTHEQAGRLEDCRPNYSNYAGDKFLAADISANGKFFAAGVDDNVFVWDLVTRKIVFQLRKEYVNADGNRFTRGPELGEITSVAFSPYGNLVAASDSKEVVFFNIAKETYFFLSGGIAADTRKKRKLCTFGGLRLHTLEFVDEDRKLLCATRDHLRLFEISDSTPICAIEQQAEFAGEVSASADGRRVATITQSGRLGLWDTTTGEKAASFIGETRLLSCGLSPNGNFLITGDAAGRVHLLAVENPNH